MPNQSNLRLNKIHERDERIKKVHQLLPELANIDRQQADLALEFIKKSLQTNKNDRQFYDEQYKQLEQKKEQILISAGLDLSIYEPNWECEKCQDRGYIEPGVPCICSHYRRLMKSRHLAGLPSNYEQMTFELFSAKYYLDPEDIEEKCKRLRIFIENLLQEKPMGNLILRGPVGCGKTHLAVAVANELLSLGRSVLYARCDAFLHTLREEMFERNDSTIQPTSFQRALKVDLLILDDLGRESVTEFSITQLANLIEARNESNQPWIINTNLTPDEIEDLYGQRLSDRLFEKTSVFRLESKESIRLARDNKGVTLI